MIWLEIFSDQVTLGEHKREKKGEGNLAELDIEVKKVIVHPSYDDGLQLNDISLLYLAEEIELTTYTLYQSL